MTLQSTGNLSIKLAGAKANDRSIQWEIEGNDTGNYSLRDGQANSDPEFKDANPLPISIRDFEGYSHDDFGDCYGQSDGTRTGWIKRVTHGGTYEITTGDTTAVKKFDADQNENTRCDKDNAGTAFTSADKCIATLYRDERDASGINWVQVQSWNGPSGSGTWYLSNEVACDFETYNYKWLLAQGV